MARAVPSPTVVAFRQRRPVPAVFSPLDIRPDRCKGCGLCVATCPSGVLELDPSAVNALGYHPVVLHDAPRCTSCALCARICPDAVIEVFARPMAVPA